LRAANDGPLMIMSTGAERQALIDVGLLAERARWEDLDVELAVGALLDLGRRPTPTRCGTARWFHIRAPI
jgi:hypothetical protein